MIFFARIIGGLAKVLVSFLDSLSIIACSSLSLPPEGKF
jgi:hypothetical protein